MGRNVRKIVAIGIVGCASPAITLLGCASSIGPVRAKQEMQEGRPRVPPITVDRLTGCMSVHGEQLGPGYYRFRAAVLVDEDRYGHGVRTDDIGKKAREFTKCTRNVLSDMGLPANFDQWVEIQKAFQDGNVAKAQRIYLGIPVVVVGAALVLSDLVLEAGTITIVFSIAFSLVNETAEVARRRPKKSDDDECIRHYDACMWTDLAHVIGNNWNSTRCNQCRGICEKYGTWPTNVSAFSNNGSCEYWKPWWER